MADPGRGNRRYESGDLVRWYRSKMTRVEEGVDEAMDDAGQYGEDLMKHYIETRGTAKSGKPGRVDTGKMRDAVGHRKTTQGGSRQLRIGWVTGTREDYFQFQETGFTHVSGVPVEGMHALQDATDAALTQLMQDLRRNVKDV